MQKQREFLYVFIKKEILGHMRFWKQNTNANIANIVDSPKLFEFVDTVMNVESQWTKGFECVQNLRRLKYIMGNMFKY